MSTQSQQVDEAKLFSDLRTKLGSRLMESDFKIDSNLFNTISVVKSNITEVLLAVSGSSG